MVAQEDIYSTIQPISKITIDLMYTFIRRRPPTQPVSTTICDGSLVTNKPKQKKMNILFYTPNRMFNVFYFHHQLNFWIYSGGFLLLFVMIVMNCFHNNE